MNDADLEMAEAHALGDAMHRAQVEHGVCFHNSSKGDAYNDRRRCLECGQVFASSEELDEARDDVLAEYT